MSRRRCGRLLAALLAGLALLLSACTGIPSSSAPQSIEPIRLNGTVPSPSISPAAGSSPSRIVSDFLLATASDPASSSLFLTSAARSQWSDTTVTILDDAPQVGTYDRGKHTVTVTGRLEGKIDAQGIYSAQQGPAAFTYSMSQVDGQYRIAGIRPNGVLLSDQQFHGAFSEFSVYFYDLADKYLVPDPRWTALTDPTAQAQWLVRQLVNTLRPLLQNTVSTDTLPAQLTDNNRIVVTAGNPTQVEIPGSSQLAGPVRTKLATQLSAIIDQVQPGHPLQITDNKQIVSIPGVGDQFTLGSFAPPPFGPQAPDAAVYYVQGGQIRTSDGNKIAGALGSSPFALQSIALGQTAPGTPLLAAGVSGTDAQSATLVVGSQDLGLKATSLHGALSRPAFAPGSNEVWVGVGSALYRVTVNGLSGTPTRVPLPLGPAGGRILAVRLSPEGTRIAIVVSGADGNSLYIGSIVRQEGQTRVDNNWTLLNPADTVITDVAWLDPLRLVAVGYLSTPEEPRLFEFGVDGSEWVNQSINLVNRPDSVTVAPGHAVWVSAAGTIWVQDGVNWRAPVKTPTPGTNPVYVE